MQPGETITPGGQPTPQQPQKPEEVLPKVDSAPEVQLPPAPEKPAEPTPTTEPAAPLTQQEAEASGWQFQQDVDDVPFEPTSPVEPVTWSASEFIAHAKGAPWFAALGAILFVVVAIIFVVTRDIFASVLVGIGGAAFGVFAARPPRVLEYKVDNHGVQIGQKFYPYQEFKSFTIAQDSPIPSIVFLPLKRFLPPITVFCSAQETDAILDVVELFLPFEEKGPDHIENLMRKIRF